MKENCHDNLYFSPRGLSLVLAFQKNPKSRKKVAHTYILYNIWSLCWKIQNAIFCVAPDKSWFDKVNFFGGKSGKSTWDFWKLCSVTPWPHNTRFLWFYPHITQSSITLEKKLPTWKTNFYKSKLILVTDQDLEVPPWRNGLKASWKIKKIYRYLNPMKSATMQQSDCMI